MYIYAQWNNFFKNMNLGTYAHWIHVSVLSVLHTCVLPACTLQCGCVPGLYPFLEKPSFSLEYIALALSYSHPPLL